MAGHSKWANRVHRKTRQDKKRGKLFAKLSRQIIVAARQGGGDPEHNTQLRTAIEQAKVADMPKDNIENAVKRSSGEMDGMQFEHTLYEAYGPAGIALMIDCLTDNAQRTVAEIRSLMKKLDASMGDAGSVTWMFDAQGVIVVPKDEADEDTVFTVAIEAGAEDILEEDDTWEIRTQPQDFDRVYEAVNKTGIPTERAEVTMVPKTTTPVPDDQANKVLRLLDELNDHDDVQHVFSNFEISDEILEKMEV